ncbi:MAG: hypothetical protein QXU26_03570 [Thermofilaceae archaeon]
MADLQLPPAVAEELGTWPGVMERLYIYCLAGCPVFDTEEHLFALAIYAQDQLVYGFDETVAGEEEREKNLIQEFMESGGFWNPIEVYGNTKLLGLLYNNELVYTQITPRHARLRAELDRNPVWRYLTGSS